MALQKQITSVPFTQGVDTKTDPKLAVKPARLENMVFDGGPLQKRPGRKSFSTSIDTGGTLSTGEALFMYGQELTRINSGTAYGYSPSTKKWDTKQGDAQYYRQQLTELIRNSTTQSQFDQAIVGQIQVISWMETGGTQQGLHIAVRDIQSGSWIQTGAIAVSGTSTHSVPRLSVVGLKVLVATLKTSTHQLFTTYIDTASPSTAPPAPTQFSASAYGTVFDMCELTSGYAVAVYASNVAKQQLTIATILGDGTAGPLSIAAYNPASTINLGLCIRPLSTGDIVLFWSNSATNSTLWGTINSAFAATGSGTIVASGSWSGGTAQFVTAATAEITTGQATIIMTQSDVTEGLAGSGANGKFLGTASVYGNGSGIATAFSELAETNGLSVTSDLVRYGSRWLFGAVNGCQEPPVLNAVALYNYEGFQATSWVLDSTGRVVSRGGVGECGIPGLKGIVSFTTPRTSRSIVSNAIAHFLFSDVSRAFFTQSGATIVYNTNLGISDTTLTLIPGGQLSTDEEGLSYFTSGSLPKTYDGASIVETGFPLYPEVNSLTTSANGATALSAGAYQYAFLISYVNAKGELVRGPPSAGVIGSVTANANDKTTIRLYPVPCSGRDITPGGAKCVLEVYRTTANGTVFYRQSSVTSPTFNAPTYSGTTSGYIEIVDTTTDTLLRSGELLYTTGGILPWDAPPAYFASCSHKGRLIVCGLRNPFQWWASSVSVSSEQPRFSSVNAYSIPTNTGPLVGCASLDGKLILFTTQAAYMVVGDGPDNLGNNPYPPPELITSVETGPISPASIVATNFGVMFQSDKGICLLDRSLGFQFVGADVEQWSTGAWLVRSATVHPLSQQVRFQADPGSDIVGAQTGTLVPSVGGVALVWDYYYQQWSVFGAPSIGTGGDYGAQDACLYGQNYAMVRSDGKCWLEQPGTWLDDGTSYSSVVETPWVKMAAIQGFQRIYYVEVLGTYGSDHTLNWDVAYSYSSTDPDVPTYSENLAYDGHDVFFAGHAYEVRHHCGQKCSSVKFRFYDTGITGNGEGMQLSDLTFEYGIKGTAFKLPASKTA